MGTIIKVISIVLVAVLAVAALGSIFTVGAETVKYMSRQNFSFSEAVKWAIADYRDWLNNLFSKKDDIIEYEFTNKKVNVVACTAL